MSAITATPKSVRPHVMVAELEAPEGGRYWSAPMFKQELDIWIQGGLEMGDGLSDIDCSATCWCAA